ncbi:MAG: carboxynorspermidine decarboxylase, partial [Verrucomicrobia bacterium]|nr:carboxynorspermidine decarboxylase [Verrucomicrobiota bacterium]
PCYVVDTQQLRRNLKLINTVQERTGAKVILALKGFAMFSVFPIVREYLCGTTASSVNEAKLGSFEFGGEVHAYAPAYSELDIDELSPLIRHITFNSFSQFHRFKERVASINSKVSMGLRINPEYSEVSTALYDPCRPCSRLGMTLGHFQGEDLDGVEGLHFHTMCEQNSDTLERTLAVVEEKFSQYFNQLKWINFGGGHHLTRRDYDIERLCRTINALTQKYSLQVYMEPGEAIALNTGYLISSVMDVFENSIPLAILDTSATAHMPDVLEMPYRPVIQGASEPGSKPHTIRLGGLTCLAGDEIGDYSFDQPLKVGDRLVFEDMAHYTMVKNTTFNGVHLPSIATYDPITQTIKVIRKFGYEDYRDRLS